MLTRSFPKSDEILAQIRSSGFGIFPGAISTKIIESIRGFWLDQYLWKKTKSKVLRGNLRLGEPNFLSYTDTSYWKLYRDFDFLWNRPTHQLTRKLMIEIHQRRNLAQSLSEHYGLTFGPEKYGIYVSTSLYPVGGYLEAHTDGHRDIPILQFMVPISGKGKDFTSGGLFLVNQKGKKIDVDGMMEPGDIAFFDGRMKHGVDKIGGASLGRVACFAIPTHFVAQDELPRPLRLLEKAYLGIERRLRGEDSYLPV